MMTRMLKTVESVLKFIVTVLLAVTVVCLFYAVLMRYIFHNPPAWSMELSRFLFIWMVIFSAVLVTREESHIQIKFIIDRMPRTVRFVWSNVLRLLMIGFCWVMVRQGLVIFPLVSEASTPTLGVSMGWLYLAIPVGGVLMGIYLLEAVVMTTVAFFKEDPEGEASEC